MHWKGLEVGKDSKLATKLIKSYIEIQIRRSSTKASKGIEVVVRKRNKNAEIREIGSRSRLTTEWVPAYLKTTLKQMETLVIDVEDPTEIDAIEDHLIKLLDWVEPLSHRAELN